MRIHADTDIQTIWMYSACIACIRPCLKLHSRPWHTYTNTCIYMHIHATQANTYSFICMHCVEIHAIHVLVFACIANVFACSASRIDTCNTFQYIRNTWNILEIYTKYMQIHTKNMQIHALFQNLVPLVFYYGGLYCMYMHVYACIIAIYTWWWKPIHAETSW